MNKNSSLSSVCSLPPTAEETNPPPPKLNSEEVLILNQLRPLVRKFVAIVKDYTKFVELSQNYSGKLDPGFVAGVTRNLVAAERDIRNLVGSRWPKAITFLDEKFLSSLMELEERAKAAIKGTFAEDFEEVFMKILENCDMFIKIIRLHFTDAQLASISPMITPRDNQPEATPVAIPPRKIEPLKRRKTTNEKFAYCPQNVAPEIRKNDSFTLQAPVTKWRCFKCTVMNTKGDKCNMCGEPKPVMYDQLASSPSQSHFVDGGRVNTTTKWICTCCKFINTSASLLCQMCNQPQVQTTIIENGWNCYGCSVLNNFTSTKCSACAKPRGTRGRSVSSPHLDISIVSGHNTLGNVTNREYLRKVPSKRKIIPLSQANIKL